MSEPHLHPLYKRVLECRDMKLDLCGESAARVCGVAVWGVGGVLRSCACVRESGRQGGCDGHREGAGERPVRCDIIGSLE
jgi:hypothetical protein